MVKELIISTGESVMARECWNGVDSTIEFYEDETYTTLLGEINGGFSDYTEKELTEFAEKYY